MERLIAQRDDRLQRLDLGKNRRACGTSEAPTAENAPVAVMLLHMRARARGTQRKCSGWCAIDLVIDEDVKE